MNLPKDTVYLGDGVYVNESYGQIHLFTSDGIRITNEISLEVEVLLNFQVYINDRTAKVLQR